MSPPKVKHESDIRIVSIGHATVIMEFGETRILCDPHFYSTFGSGQFGFYPERVVSVESLPHVDAVFISHSHRDHFDVRSLATLDRRIPIFCPKDMRIEHVLRKLGFRDVMNVGDWTTIRPNADLAVTWTPSTYRVPEFGFAFKYKRRVVWNMVDSVVKREWVDRLLSALDADCVDLLLAPCQPLLETAVYESAFPAPKGSHFYELEELFKLAKPRYVVPFADGHLCCGRATWLNHHKIPVSEERIVHFLKAALPWATILELHPGDAVMLHPSGDAQIQKQAVSYVSTVSYPSRSFHPGGYIEPLRSYSSNSIASDALMLDLIRLGMDQSAAPLAAGFFGLLQDCNLIDEYVYRLILVDSRGEIVAQHCFQIAENGTLVQADATAPVDIDVAITSEVLSLLQSGELNYSAAYLAGHIREYRAGLVTQEKVVIGYQDVESSRGKIVLSGTCVFNLLITRGPNAMFRALEVELSGIPSTTSASTPLNEGPVVTSQEERFCLPLAPIILQSTWLEIEEALLRGEDPAKCSGTTESKDGPIYCGILGDSQWVDQSITDELSIGRLFLHNFSGPQPHWGMGVRFPKNAYFALLNNILESPIQYWTLDPSVPGRAVIPKWRLTSLFPIASNRLLIDLRRRGWKGEISSTEYDKFQISGRWWNGMPRIENCCVDPRVDFVVEGVRYSGLLNASMEALQCGSGQLSFRLDIDRDKISGISSLSEFLLSAPYRFSWLLTEHETHTYFPNSRSMNLERWISRMAIPILREAMDHLSKTDPQLYHKGNKNLSLSHHF